MHVIAWLEAGAAVMGASAAWGALWSPRARRLKAERASKETRDQKVHDALFGDGVLYPGLISDMGEIKAKLNAPLLNGKGDALITTVSRLDKRTARQGRQITSIERRLTEVER